MVSSIFRGLKSAKFGDFFSSFYYTHWSHHLAVILEEELDRRHVYWIYNSSSLHPRWWLCNLHFQPKTLTEPNQLWCFCLELRPQIGKSWIEFIVRSKKCEVARYQVTQCSSTSWVNPRWCQHVILMEVIQYHVKHIHLCNCSSFDMFVIFKLPASSAYVYWRKKSFWGMILGLHICFFCFAGWTQDSFQIPTKNISRL